MTIQQHHPNPRGSALPPPEKRMASRKLFNCILDDTALIAGLKKSTRDGVKKWINNGSIRIYVPLHSRLGIELLQDMIDI